MKMFLTAHIAGGLMLGVAGCSGPTVQPPDVVPMTFQQQIDAGTDMYDRSEFLPYSLPASIPTSGSARYQGFVATVIDYPGVDWNSVIGNLTLDANFANDTISGSASNFVDIAGENYSGSLAVTSGVYDRTLDPVTDWTIAADIGGTLTDTGAVTYAVDGEMFADFIGVNHQFIDGIVVGTVTSIDGVGTFYDGSVIAER